MSLDFATTNNAYTHDVAPPACEIPCTGAQTTTAPSPTLCGGGGVGATISATSNHPGGVNIAFCDGSVRFVKRFRRPADLVGALGTRNAHEIISVTMPTDDDHRDRDARTEKVDHDRGDQPITGSCFRPTWPSSPDFLVSTLCFSPSPGTIGCRSQYQIPPHPCLTTAWCFPGAGFASCGEPSGVLALDIHEPGVVRQVFPFMGIVSVVVKLLGAVRISDVPPTLRTDGMVPSIMGRDGRPRAWGVRVLELRNKTVSVQAVAGCQATKARSRSGTGRAATPPDTFTCRAGGNAGAGNDEWHASGSFPKRILARDPFFAQVPAVVGPEDDDQFHWVSASDRVEGIEHPADLASMKLVLARYALTSECHSLAPFSQESRGSGNFQCKNHENAGVSSRSSALTSGKRSVFSG